MGELPAFVDSHHHLWDLRYDYPWLQADPPLELVCGSVGPISVTYAQDAFTHDVGELPLVFSVHVEAGRSGDSDVETQWLLRSTSDPRVAARLVARVDLTGDDLAAELAAHIAHPEVTAVRDIAAYHLDPRLSQTGSRDPLADPCWVDNLAVVRDAGLGFDLQIYPEQADDVARALAATPGLRVAFEHALMPADRSRSGIDAWHRAVRRLSALPDVVVKISGLGMCLHNGRPEEWRAIVAELVEAFGPKRCMLGSNFPVDSMFVEYAEVWDLFDSATADLTAAERSEVFTRTAARFYRFDLEPNVSADAGERH